MLVKIAPGCPKGKIAAPPSKSMAHRYLIAAALAGGKSVISGVEYSKDILATLQCLQALGVGIKCNGSTVTVNRSAPFAPREPLQCEESGSTLRFILPLCLLSGKEAVLVGKGRLPNRPQSVYETLAREQGFRMERSDQGILVQGILKNGSYAVDSSISSQFVTGLIFALLMQKGDSTLLLQGKTESRSYIDLTIKALEAFGFTVTWETPSRLFIPGGQAGKSGSVTVEGDYSNAAFFDALNLVGGQVEVTGLSSGSLQGDRVYKEYFKALEQGKPTLSLADCPDLGPILMAVAAARNGAELIDTARLKIKESDRGVAMAAELKKCGVSVTLEENRIIIPPQTLVSPAEVINSHNDHRIVMAMSVLCCKLGGTIRGGEAVEKSMPRFFECLKDLGMEVFVDATE